LVQGITSSKANKYVFRNGDAAHLDELLSRSEHGRPKLVVFESVYSMSGLKCNVVELCTVARRYGALTFVDEVHAVGLYGRNGGGIGELLSATDSIDILVGSLGEWLTMIMTMNPLPNSSESSIILICIAKALGTTGAYLTGSSAIVDAVRCYAPGFVFTTSISPMALAGSLMSLHILRSEEGIQLRQKHQYNVNFLKNLLSTAGLPVEINDSHIIPIIVCEQANQGNVITRVTFSNS